jgi:thiamine-monophosphate kinase
MAVHFGDDVAAYDIGNGRVAVLKTDMLVGKTDMPRGMSLWQAARKAVVMNVSDFAAKGVQPEAILVSLGLPKGMTKKQIIDIGEGLDAGAREYGAYVVGGDTGEATDLIISLSVFGLATKGEIILRSGAKPGDLVAVTGFFGKTSAGLKILMERSESSRKLHSVLVDSVLMPHARLKEGLALRQKGVVTASVDSSDGLAWSLHEISRASKVGMLLEKLPVATEVEEFAKSRGLNATELALYGGEEYELVLTIRPDCWETATAAVEEVGGELLKIGKVTAGHQVVLEADRKRLAVEPRGYEHFLHGSV